jgi:Protein of unknown function (DUF3303)
VWKESLVATGDIGNGSSAAVLESPYLLKYLGWSSLSGQNCRPLFHGEDTMLFMVIERFQDNDMVPIYKRVRDGGRMLPDGLKYIDSWVEPNFSRCFQLMECDDLKLFQQWALMWRGSGATLEIVPVVSSKETRDVVAPHLDEL